MKDIKDYLPFYIGCEVAREHDKSRSEKFCEYGKLVGISESEIERGKTVAILDVGIDHFHEWYVEETKPILRPLSSMTEEEAKEVVKRRSPAGSVKSLDRLVINHIDSTSITWSFLSVPNIPRWERFGELSPDQFIYLLSKGFDLFNLIPENLAIEKTK